MATVEWVGRAANVQQIQELLTNSTWVADDQIILYTTTDDDPSTPITSLEITFQGAAGVKADTAPFIVRCFNSDVPINDADGSCNVGGQSIPEFAELIASIDPDDAGNVLFTNRNSRDYGRPFRFGVTSDGTGPPSFTYNSVQVATSQWHWDNPANWSGLAVPVNDDVVVFRDTDNDCLYGLPDTSLQVPFVVYNTFVGSIGLPKVNQSNRSKPYREYRQRHVRLDDAGSGSSISHTIGYGPGNGPKLVNISQTVIGGATFTIDCNSRAEPNIIGEGAKVVNLACGGSTVGTLIVRNGSVDISNQDGVTAKWSTISTVGVTKQIGSIDILSIGNAATDCTVKMVGGQIEADWATWSTNGLTINGGRFTLSTAGIPTATISEGELVDRGTGTITTLTLNSGGVLDVSQGSGTITITNSTFQPGCKVVNPGNRITHTNATQVYGVLSAVASQLDYGYNRTIKIA